MKSLPYRQQNLTAPTVPSLAWQVRVSSTFNELKHIIWLQANTSTIAAVSIIVAVSFPAILLDQVLAYLNQMLHTNVQRESGVSEHSVGMLLLLVQWNRVFGTPEDCFYRRYQPTTLTHGHTWFPICSNHELGCPILYRVPMVIEHTHQVSVMERLIPRGNRFRFANTIARTAKIWGTKIQGFVTDAEKSTQTLPFTEGSIFIWAEEPHLWEC